MFKRQANGQQTNSNINLLDQIDLPDSYFGNFQKDFSNQISIKSLTESQEINQNFLKESFDIKGNDSMQFPIIQSKAKHTKQLQPKSTYQSFERYFCQDSSQYQAGQVQQSKQKFNSKRSQQNKMYAKNYREKRKQQFKALEEENRFLKNKVDDLSFRLKQVQLELNKLKYNNDSHIENFQTSKQICLNQIKQVLQKSQSDFQKLLEVKKNFNDLNAFNNKHKTGLLNYFMSELLENLISDMGFYFIDSILSKKGFWKESQTTQLRKLDQDILELHDDAQQVKKIKQMMNAMPESILQHMKNFKNLWKKLYQDYLNIINQGLFIEGLCQPALQKVEKQISGKQIRNYLKLQMFFQKAKYRKDIRQLRGAWFKQFQSEQQQSRASKNVNSCKKAKINSE